MSYVSYLLDEGYSKTEHTEYILVCFGPSQVEF